MTSSFTMNSCSGPSNVGGSSNMSTHVRISVRYYRTPSSSSQPNCKNLKRKKVKKEDNHRSIKRPSSSYSPSPPAKLPRALRELCDFNGPGRKIGYGNTFLHGEYEPEDQTEDAVEYKDDVHGRQYEHDMAEETLIGFDRTNPPTVDELLSKAFHRMNVPTTRSIQKVLAATSSAATSALAVSASDAVTTKEVEYGLYVVYAGGMQTKRLIRVFESSDLQDGDQCELIDLSDPSVGVLARRYDDLTPVTDPRQHVHQHRDCTVSVATSAPSSGMKGVNKKKETKIKTVLSIPSSHNHIDDAAAVVSTGTSTTDRINQKTTLKGKKQSFSSRSSRRRSKDSAGDDDEYEYEFDDDDDDYNDVESYDDDDRSYNPHFIPFQKSKPGRSIKESQKGKSRGIKSTPMKNKKSSELSAKNMKYALDYDNAFKALKDRYLVGSVVSVDLDGRRFFDAVIEQINHNTKPFEKLSRDEVELFKQRGPPFWVHLRFSQSVDSVGKPRTGWFDFQTVRHFILSRPDRSKSLICSKKKRKQLCMEESTAVVYNDNREFINDFFTSPDDVKVGDRVSVMWDYGQDYKGTVIKVLPWVRAEDVNEPEPANEPSSAVCVRYDDGDICWSNLQEEDGFIILKHAKSRKRARDVISENDETNAFVKKGTANEKQMHSHLLDNKADKIDQSASVVSKSSNARTQDCTETKVNKKKRRKLDITDKSVAENRRGDDTKFSSDCASQYPNAFTGNVSGSADSNGEDKGLYGALYTIISEDGFDAAVETMNVAETVHRMSLL